MTDMKSQSSTIRGNGISDFLIKKSYHRQLAALYAELKREDDSFYIQQIMYSKDMLEKHSGAS